MLECAAVAIVPPDEPGNHPGVRCKTLLEGGTDEWHLEIPAGVTAMILELAWNQTTELSNTMALQVHVSATGDSLGLAEGLSMVKLQLAQDQLRRNLEAGTTA